MNVRSPYVWFSGIGLIALVAAALAIFPNLSGGAQATATPTASSTDIPATATKIAPTGAPQDTATPRPSATATVRATFTPANTATSAATATLTKRATQAGPTPTAQPQATAQPTSTAVVPTAAPTEPPTEQPTQAPTSPPLPTATTALTATPIPTTAPTEQPTEIPTTAPTEAPTESPTTLAAGFTSPSTAGLDMIEAEFVSAAQSSSRVEARASNIDWMELLWRWTGTIVVVFFAVVGALLWLSERAAARPAPDQSR